MPKPNKASAVSKVGAILDERQSTHGDFTENARVMQAMKNVAKSGVSYNSLNDIQREALDMILHKVGRIVTGNPYIHDHWDDIAGYAQLVSDRIPAVRK